MPSARSAAEAPRAEAVLAGETSWIADTDAETNSISKFVSAWWSRAVSNVIPPVRIDGNRLRRLGHLEKEVRSGRFLGERGRDQDGPQNQHRDTADPSRWVQQILLPDDESTPAGLRRHLFAGKAAVAFSRGGHTLCAAKASPSKLTSNRLS